MKKLLLILALLLPAPSFGASVSWVCDRATPKTGTATGTTNWQIQVTAAVGLNNCTVTATDDQGGVSTDTFQWTYAPTFPGNTLAGAWGFEDGSGTTATDSSGNNNTGTLQNGAAWVTPGRFGKAIQFNGINQYVRVLDANSLDFTQSFTLSAWIQPTTAHTDFRAVIHKESVTDFVNFTPASPYELYGTSGGVCAVGALIGLSNANGILGPDPNACDPNPAPINQWTHVALTYDFANLKLYRDGVLIQTTPMTGYLEPSALNLDIGASEFGEYFQGLIDEVRVYNYAIPLTAAGNTTFGAACVRADELTTPSVIGDANCSIVLLPAPFTLKWPAGASTIKMGSAATGNKYGSH